MANVNSRAAVERGQVILVLGLLIAVMFVAIAMLLNSVIYTQNLASRGESSYSREPIEFERSVETGTGALLDAENEQFYATNQSVRENVSSGIERIDRIFVRRYGRRGIVTNISIVTVHNGSILRQNDSSREMTSVGGAADWTLAEDIRDVRGFRVNITGGLNTTSDPEGGFRVRIENGSKWALAVYLDSGVEMAVYNGSWTTGICDPPATPPVTIDLTRGTVAGKQCAAIDFGEGVPSRFDLDYVRGRNATGTYELVVNVSGPGDVRETNFNGPGMAPSPSFARAVYDVGLRVRWETRLVTYESRVQVAPGGEND